MPGGIRPAVLSDLARIEAIVEAAYRPYLSRMDRRPAPMDDDYARRIAEDLVFVLEEDGEICGLLVLEAGPDHLLLDNIAVDPARHRRGIGRRLITFTEDEARRRGNDRIELFTNEVMAENIAMYLHLGYIETGRRRDRGYDRVYFRKTL